MRKIVRLLSLCLVSFAAVSCLAQNTNSGDITGTVTDNDGAIVPGVTVTIVNVNTGVSKTLVTNSAGVYDTNSIVTGDYKLTFVKTGFQTLIRGPITVEVGSTAVNAQLTVGSVSQEVKVTTNVPLLRTEEGEQSTTLPFETMNELPQASGGATWTTFTIMLPGTAMTPAGGEGMVNGNAGEDTGLGVSMNGNMPYASNFLADGATSTLPASANADTSIFETVAEVQMITSSFSAEYSGGGAVFNQISKGGSNQFHGAAYEFFQSSQLNAPQYTFPGSPVTNPYERLNQYGIAIGGPVLKNKMFFYFDWDDEHDNGSSAGLHTVPTLAMREGNFAGFPTIYDPTTETLVNGVPVRQPYANNQIPQNELDPVALKAQAAAYPLPNVAGTVNAQYPGEVSNNYFESVPSPVQFPRYFGRLDYDINKSNRLTATVTERDKKLFTQRFEPCPISCTNGDVAGYNAQISDVWTINPRMVNEARIGFTRQGNWFQGGDEGKGYPAQLGLQYSKGDVFPNITPNSGVQSIGGGTNAVQVENVFDTSDVVSLVEGRHILHFGAELVAYQDNATPWGNINSGNFTFDGRYTKSFSAPAGTSTGTGYADFLLGQAESWSATNESDTGARAKNPQFFAQDDFKIKPNFTLNAGIRYQIQTGWSVTKNALGSFDPNLLNPTTGTLGAMWFASNKVPGRSNAAEKTVYNTFLPRIGFSWSPKPQWVLRGGYGLYAIGWSQTIYLTGQGDGYASTGSVADESNGVTPFLSLSGDGTLLNGNGSINDYYLKASTAPDAFNGQSVNYDAYNTPVWQVNEWSLSLQRSLGNDMVAQLSYVASRAYNLPFPVNINQVPENLLSVNDRNNLPYPQFQQINGNTYNALSNYNSMQAEIQKRMSNGLSFNINYTWSHFLDDQDVTGWSGHAGPQYYQNAYKPSQNYGPSNFDIADMFKVNSTYELPIGRGKLVPTSNPVLDAIAGGWRLSGILVAQTGNPFTALIGNENNSYAQSGNWYANQIGNPHVAHRSINEWFNPAAFTTPAPGTFGTVGRNTLRGPGLWVVNASFGKNFPIKEKVNFQFRVDATNLFNHPSFDEPGQYIDQAGAGVMRSTSIPSRNLQLSGRLSF